MCSLIVVSASVSHADWLNVADEWEPYKLSPDQKSWFRSVQSPNNVLCCDVADGHPSQAEQRPRTQEQIAAGMSEWWVVISNDWQQVPEAAVVYHAENPTGIAIVWYSQNQVQGQPRFIRCFVPSGGV
jgi:hypothetical protein